MQKNLQDSDFSAIEKLLNADTGEAKLNLSTLADPGVLESLAARKDLARLKDADKILRIIKQEARKRAILERSQKTDAAFGIKELLDK